MSATPETGAIVDTMTSDTQFVAPQTGFRGLFARGGQKPRNGSSALNLRPVNGAAASGAAPVVGGGITDPATLDEDGADTGIANFGEPGGASETTPDNHNVVHEALKSVDVWFAYQVSALEREASRLAQEWAQRGLPRHDLVSDEGSQAEQVLASRAAEIYAAWIQRAQRKIAAATARQVRRLQQAVTHGQHALQAYRQAARDFSETARQSELEREAQKELSLPAPVHTHPTVLAQRQLHNWFWPLIITLVVAEFVANAPLFTELFPLNLEVDRRVNEWLAAETGSVVWLGLVASGMRLIAAPEPTFLALSVVMFFLFLGHQAGENVHTLVAFQSEHAHVPHIVRQRRRRQARVAMFAALGGVILTVGVLFDARSTVLSAAEEKLAAADGRVAAAAAELRSAETTEGRERISSLRDSLWALTDERNAQAARTEYAASITRLNGPVTGLNLVLAVVALLAGYFRKEVVVSADEKNETSAPVVQAPDDVLGRLRLEMSTRRLEIKQHLDEGEVAYALSQQLLQSDGTAHWLGIVERLQSAIPRYRSENALLRHLDPRDIKAFQASAVLTLPAPERMEPSEEIVELMQSQREALGLLTTEWRQIEGRLPHTSTPTAEVN